MNPLKNAFLSWNHSTILFWWKSIYILVTCSLHHVVTEIFFSVRLEDLWRPLVSTIILMMKLPYTLFCFPKIRKTNKQKHQQEKTQILIRSSTSCFCHTLETCSPGNQTVHFFKWVWLNQICESFSRFYIQVKFMQHWWNTTWLCLV